jgi:hypothetical protein
LDFHRKREHLLNQIREQAAEIQKLMTQLEETNARQLKPPNSAATDSFPLTPSTAATGGALHSPVLSSSPTTPKAESENNRAVEDWIAKARDSLAEFDGFIGIGGAGMPKSLLVKEDLEDSASDGEEEDEAAEDAADSQEESSPDRAHIGAFPRPPIRPPTPKDPVADRVLILVTADSERYVNVDISGATNPAFIRERVFTKVRICRQY